METINQILALLRAGTIELPALEVMLVLSALSITMALRLSRSGLLIAFVCSYRWGWLFYSEALFSQNAVALTAYVLFGATTLFLSLLWFLRGSGDQ